MTLFELCFKQLIKDSEFFGMNNEICIEKHGNFTYPVFYYPQLLLFQWAIVSRHVNVYWSMRAKNTGNNSCLDFMF
jgi:hypothetical protein